MVVFAVLPAAVSALRTAVAPALMSLPTRCGIPLALSLGGNSGVRRAAGVTSRLYSSESAANSAAAAPAPIEATQAPAEPATEQIPTTIYGRVKEDVKKAMKARDRTRATVLKGILSDITYAEKRRDPPQKIDNDRDVVGVIRKALNRHADSIAMFRAGGREDLAINEEAEAAILKEFLPDQLTAKEVDEIVLQTCKDVGAKHIKDFYRVMDDVPICPTRAPKALITKALSRYLTEPEKYDLC